MSLNSAQLALHSFAALREKKNFRHLFTRRICAAFWILLRDSLRPGGVVNEWIIKYNTHSPRALLRELSDAAIEAARKKITKTVIWLGLLVCPKIEILLTEKNRNFFSYLDDNKNVFFLSIFNSKRMRFTGKSENSAVRPRRTVVNWILLHIDFTVPIDALSFSFSRSFLFSAQFSHRRSLFSRPRLLFRKKVFPFARGNWKQVSWRVYWLLPASENEKFGFFFFRGDPFSEWKGYARGSVVIFEGSWGMGWDGKLCQFKLGRFEILTSARLQTELDDIPDRFRPWRHPRTPPREPSLKCS